MSQGALSTSAAADGSRSAADVSILVVDDAPLDRKLVGNLVEQCLGWRVHYAANGAEALAYLERNTPDLVLADLQMPKINGLELVQAMRDLYPMVPVVLMSAYGNEEIAIQALRKGAASYLPKVRLERDLVETLDQVLTAARATHNRQRLLKVLSCLEMDFALPNDRTLISPLVLLLQEHLAAMKLCDDTDLLRISIALEEALVNALYHGNLEVGSEVRDRDDRLYYQLAEDRTREKPYCDRRIHVVVKLSTTEAVYVIRDEGPGFNPDAIPDPTDPENLEMLSGRGLLLMRSFMDDVIFNDQGNQVTLVKKAKG